jgi:hypothetical protein
MIRALALTTALLATACLERKHRDPPPPDPAAERAERAAKEAAEQARRAAVEAAVTTPPRLADAACPAGVKLPSVPALGDLQLAWSDDLPAGRAGDQTGSYLLTYLRLIGSEVEVVNPLASGAPLDRRSGFDHGARITLIVDQWTEPVLPAERTGNFVVGHLVGRLLVWDPAAKAFVCGATVDARNGNVTLVDSDGDALAGRPGAQEDALSKVRVDLVNEAIRDGLAHLHAVAHG